MGVPLAGSWDGPSQTLTITQLDPSTQEQQLLGDNPDAFPAATAAAAAAGDGCLAARQQQMQQCGSGGDNDEGLPQEMLLNSPKFRLKEWLEGLKDGVINRNNIPHAQLPLQVRPCTAVCVCEVVVVVCGCVRGGGYCCAVKG